MGFSRITVPLCVNVEDLNEIYIRLKTSDIKSRPTLRPVYPILIPLREKKTAVASIHVLLTHTFCHFRLLFTNNCYCTYLQTAVNLLKRKFEMLISK